MDFEIRAILKILEQTVITLLAAWYSDPNPTLLKQEENRDRDIDYWHQASSNMAKNRIYTEVLWTGFFLLCIILQLMDILIQIINSLL